MVLDLLPPVSKTYNSPDFPLPYCVSRLFFFIMLASIVPFCLLLAILFHKWHRRHAQGDSASSNPTVKTEGWVEQQIDIASFHSAVDANLQTRLHLRAIENRRLKAAFGIENSLTTDDPKTHKAYLKMVSGLLNKTRCWEKLYSTAESFVQGELDLATRERQSLRLAESVRCMVLAVVLFDSFDLDPDTVERSDLVTITNEINSQWLKSKCNPDTVTPSDLLNSTIASLHLQPPPGYTSTMTPTNVLGLLMPQYETLWRVVLLTFVTAYHHQPAAYPDTVQRTVSVPSCLGDTSRETEALELAQVCPPPFIIQPLHSH